MKKKLLTFLWRLQFKRIPYTGIKGYHCRGCVAHEDPTWCGDYYYPCEQMADQAFAWRFKKAWYRNLLSKLHKLLIK